ncbi:MAG: GTP-binding protein, partial [Christensenellales bacterium]
MKTYSTKQIRNVGMIGHGGEGKTTLTEAMLFTSGAISRMGSVDAGTATTDYDPEETKRQISIGSALAPVEWNGHKINVIDAPGYFDFEGEVLSTLSVADAAIIVVGAVSGVTVGAEKAFKLCKDRELPRAFVVNRMDTENANFEKVFDALREQFGPSVVPLQIPIMKGGKFVGYVDVVSQEAIEFDPKQNKVVPIPENLETEVDHYRSILVESAAESSEELMEKYFEGEEFTPEELTTGIRLGILTASLTPVFCTAAV